MQSLFSIQDMATFIGWSFGVTAFLMVIEVVLLRRRRQQLVKRIGRTHRKRRNSHSAN